jgi:hypothetical protein
VIGHRGWVDQDRLVEAANASMLCADKFESLFKTYRGSRRAMIIYFEPDRVWSLAKDNEDDQRAAEVGVN